MDVPDDYSPWAVPPESPEATGLLHALDVEMGPEWQRAITGALDSLWR